MRVELKRLHQVKTRRGQGVYYYAWRGGPRVETDAAVGSPAFMAAYYEAVANAPKAPSGAGKVAELIALFKSSTEFTGLKPRTQADYLKHIATIELKFGALPVKGLADPRARGTFKSWRDGLARRSRRQADYAWSVLQRIFSVALDRGRITENPCTKGGRLYRADRTEKLWTDDHVQRFMTAAPRHLHLALMLALWTGQRQGDLLALAWSAYDGQFIRLRQGKGARRIKIPVGEPLKEMLAATPRVATVVLTTLRARAWTPDGFRASWGKACDKAGIDDVTFHDLRGSAVTRLMAAGADIGEIAALTGHSLGDVDAILDAHYFGRTTALAASGIAKLERADARKSRAGETKDEPNR